MDSGRDVLIQTDQLDTASDFYEKVLGFSIVQRSEQLIGFETGSFRLYLDKGKSYGPVFEIFVPNFEEAKRNLMRAGCRVEIEDPAIPRCYIRDPFGLTFNLAEKSPK